MRVHRAFARRSSYVSLIFLLVGFLLFSLPSGQAVAVGSERVRILQSHAEDIVLEFQVPLYTSRIAEVDGCAYQRLSIEGYGLSSAPGEPELPQQGFLVGIPPHAEASLAVLATESTVAEGFNVYPVPERRIEPLDPGRELLDQSPDFQVEFVKNQPVYAPDAFFPSAVAEIHDGGYLRDLRYVQVLIHPVQYNPVTRELKYHHYIKLQVSFDYPQGRLSLPPSRVESPAFDAVLENSILNYETAKDWRVHLQPRVQATVASLDYLSESSYRISVSRDGIYQLTYSDLLTAGLPVDSLDPRTFQLFNIGSEVAIYVEGEDDGNFDPSDYVLFYGQKMNTKYTDINIYWLIYGEAIGLRMAETDGGLTGTAITPSAFKSLLHLEEDHLYRSFLPMQGGTDHWYWDYVYAAGGAASKTYNATLNNLATGSYTPTLRAKLTGGSSSSINPDHHVKIYINDNLVGEAWWDGMIEHLTEADFPESYLVEGANAIKVECPNDTGAGSEVIMINWFEIEYYDTYVAENDSLDFSGDEAGTWEYHIGDFTTNDIAVFDIADPANATRVMNGVVEPSSSYTLKFEDTIADRTEYLAMTTAHRLSPIGIALDTPSDLHSTSNGADYIIITHADFYDEMLPLADHRAGQGLRVMEVDVQDVYDEFSHGIFDPQAIHDFLAYAYTNWLAPAPSYVLLVGDGTFDFKDNMATGVSNYIPPYLASVDPYINETAADNRYVTISGTDILPDMHVGRLPVNSSTEAVVAVNKILHYEQDPPSGDWTQEVLFVADDADAAGDFAALSDAVADSFLPASYMASKIYAGVNYPYENPSVQAKAAIMSNIGEGCLLVNYIGHASTVSWAGEKLFHVGDIGSLASSEKLPMMLPMTCYDGYFHYPGSPCLGESVVRVEDKGAIASWSATGLGLAHGHDYLDKGFFTAVFTDNIAEIGTATYLGKLKLYTETGGEASPFRDLMDTYVLFGDPFMKLNLPACDAADYDNDGRITVGDVMQVAAHWDTEWGDANFDRKYDLDDDGDVDIVDVMWVAGRWEEVC